MDLGGLRGRPDGRRSPLVFLNDSLRPSLADDGIGGGKVLLGHCGLARPGRGRIAELGTHDELIALGGRYKTMFELQAERFAAGLADEGEEEVVFDALA